jgi:hypothetical protein
MLEISSPTAYVPEKLLLSQYNNKVFLINLKGQSHVKEDEISPWGIGLGLNYESQLFFKIFLSALIL